MLLCECAGGVIAAIWPRCLGLQSSRGGAVGALQTYYALPDFEHFTAAVDLAQTEVSSPEAGVQHTYSLPNAYYLEIDKIVCCFVGGR